MGLRINLNIASLIAQANLQNNTRRLEKAFEEVSSGERINRAGDDAAGLAISQLLRSQVRSLDQAARNTGDGLSLINTAESAMGTMTNNIQRIRELAIQAANGSNSHESRVALQSEIEQILGEIDRVASTIQFNDKKLLDGTFVNQRIQVGLSATDFLPVSIPDLHVAVLGQQALATGANPVSLAAIAGAGDLTINGFDVPATAADGVSFANADASAIAKAAAINRITSLTGVTAEVEETIFQTAGASVGAVALDGVASALFINGVNIGAVNVSAGDSTGALRDAINQHSGETGVKADLAATGELVLTAADGRNVHLTTTGSVADELGLAVADGDLTAQQVTGRITLRSNGPITVAGADIGLIGFTAGQAVTNVDPATAIANVNVTTEAGAQEAIAAADAALAQLNRMRASLGAIANRLEDTINTLESTGQNLRASDSRIRDTDFAEATARLTREQILQQSATAILAQANLLPQMALRLLEQ